MGNEASQQEGGQQVGPGGQQPSAPSSGPGIRPFAGIMGGPGQTQAPSSQQGQVRPGFMGGPPPRQGAPMTRPAVRPGAPGGMGSQMRPGPPAPGGVHFPGGGGPGPRQQQTRPGMGGPVQVGIQPWAEPSQQPPRTPFRAPAPQQQMMTQSRSVTPATQQSSQMRSAPQPTPPAAAAAAAVAAAMESQDLGVDLSNLSEEEKSKILSVMARAHDLDEDYERHKSVQELGRAPKKAPPTADVNNAMAPVFVAKELTGETGDPQHRPLLLCPLCRKTDLAVEVNKMCGDCGKNFCQKCGTFVPGEGRIQDPLQYRC